MGRPDASRPAGTAARPGVRPPCLRLCEYHRPGQAQPGHHRRVPAWPALHLPGIAGTGEPGHVDPVLHGDGKAVQWPHGAAVGKGLIQPGGVGQGPVILEERHRVGPRVHLPQRGKVRRDHLCRGNLAAAKQAEQIIHGPANGHP